VILGDTGWGKTISLGSFAYYYKDNVIFNPVQKSTSPRLFYSDILNLISSEKYSASIPLNLLIKRVAYEFNSKKRDMLLIIDEVTKFDHNFFEHLQDFREMTKESTGIILAGGIYFHKKFRKWNEKVEDGMPEFYSRVNVWYKLDAPSNDVIVSIIRAYDIHDSKFVVYCSNTTDLRFLKRIIENYSIIKESNFQLKMTY